MESTLATFLESIGTVLTSAVGWMGTIAGAVVENPTLLVPFGLSIGLGAIGIFKSLS